MVTYIFIFLLTVGSANSNYVADVTDFMDKFGFISRQSVLILERLSEFSDNVDEFLDLGQPVSSLIAEAIGKTFQNGSDEQIGLELLHSDMKKALYRLELATQNMEARVFYEGIWSLYDQHLTIPLTAWHELLKNITYPYSDRRPMKEKFIDECNGLKGPINLLNKMRTQLLDACPLPSEEEAALYVRTKRLLRQIHDRITDQHDKESVTAYERLKNQVLGRITSAPQNIAETFIGALEKAASYHTPDLTGLQESEALENLNKNAEHTCVLEVVVANADYVREHIEAFAQIIKNDLSALNLLSMMCANASSAGDATKIASMKHTTSRLSKEISDGTVQWINLAQELAWPDVQTEAALSALDKVIPSNIVHMQEYNLTAQTVREEMRKRGPGLYSYNVLVAVHKEEGVQWSVKQVNQDDYTIIRAYRYVDVHIFRYPLKDFKRAKLLDPWIKTNWDPINRILNENIKGMTGDVMHLLQKELEIVRPTAYRSALLLEDKCIVWWCTFIAVGISTHPLDNSTTVNYVQVYQNGFRQLAYMMKLYVFI